MLLPDNIHPDRSVYYNGAIVLDTLTKKKKLTLIDLYIISKEQKEMSFSLFILCVDWLYLLNVAILNENGEVELCTSNH